MSAAIDYVSALGLDNIAAHEQRLLAYANNRLATIDGLEIIGQADNKAGIISFMLDGIHSHDIGTIIDARGVAVRA